MSTDKTFTVGGTSVKKGVLTWRFANGSPEARAQVLLKDNHTDIKLQALPRPMTRDEGIEYLKANGIKAVDPTAKPPKTPKPTGVLTRGDKERLAAAPKDEDIDPAVEAKARDLHNKSNLKFMSWDEMQPDTRNEYRENARRILSAEHT